MPWLLLPAMLAFVSAAPVQDRFEPISTKSGEIEAPLSGVGKIVFFRPRALMWAVLGCGVLESGNQLAKLGVGKYFTLSATPGEHRYYAGSGKKISLQVSEGQTYYIKCRISSGIIGRPTLSRSDREEFSDEASGLALTTSR